jgi:ABC-type phosphate transport system auxiliary subunit
MIGLGLTCFSNSLTCILVCNEWLDNVWPASVIQWPVYLCAVGDWTMFDLLQHFSDLYTCVQWVIGLCLTFVSYSVTCILVCSGWLDYVWPASVIQWPVCLCAMGDWTMFDLHQLFSDLYTCVQWVIVLCLTCFSNSVTCILVRSGRLEYVWPASVIQWPVYLCAMNDWTMFDLLQ